jgi:5-(carboxyamino)imidazole ribonucleotide synthase
MKIGILGAGQLGMMLGHAAKNLGHTCVFVDTSPDACASTVGELRCCSLTDLTTVQNAMKDVDVVTYEFENIPIETVRLLEQSKRVFPSSTALQYTQDRIQEKELAGSLGIDTPRFVRIDSISDLDAACETLGYPFVLKTRRLGYDGKGQMIVRMHDDLGGARSMLKAGPLIAEQFVTFDAECSFIAARDTHGQIVHLPPTKNVHKQGILHTTIFPSGLASETIRQGQAHLEKVMEHLSYIGVMTMECFLSKDALLFNEFAPRVHNSGHWSMDGCLVSQFTEHILAITGESVQSTDAAGDWGMINIIGTTPDLSRLSGMPDTFVHLYGKEEKPGRKLGHVTLRAETPEKLQSRMLAVETLLLCTSIR